jgi:hypothetical protein
MVHPIYIVGDRVRMRHPAPYASNTNGTVAMVFHSATNCYDVKFDSALVKRVCYAEDIEHNPEERTLLTPSWTDAAGTHHVAPAMCDLPPLLQLGIKRMVAIIAGSPVAQHEQATEAVTILLCVLLPHLSQDEIDRHSSNEKRHFVARWCDLQTSLLVVTA